jgi:hypothetical protein
MALFLTVLALGGCTMPDFASMRVVPDADALFRPQSVTTFRERQLGPVTANDLVDSSGRCATAGDGGGQGGGVSLDMTECEVVGRLGVPQSVNVGGEAGERVSTLTYVSGARPGNYQFIGGRLKNMERGPEPVQEQRPQRRAPPRRSADSAR